MRKKRYNNQTKMRRVVDILEEKPKRVRVSLIYPEKENLMGKTHSMFSATDRKIAKNSNFKDIKQREILAKRLIDNVTRNPPKWGGFKFEFLKD